MRLHRHWEIVIYPEQYDDEDDHGFSWAGIVPRRAKDPDRWAFNAACVDCEDMNEWEPGSVDRETTQDTDSRPCVREAVQGSLAAIGRATVAPTAKQLKAALADALQGWEHTFK